MNGTATVADHIDDRIESIIASWRSAVHRSGDVPRSRSLTYDEFIDHVPALIDRMVDRLRGRESDVSNAAEKHGHTRWTQGYDVVEVVAELGHLRTALVEATFAHARDHDFDFASLEVAHTAIHEVLNEAAAESVRQFQEDSLSHQQRNLLEIEERRRAVEDARLVADVERAKLRSLLQSLPVGVWVADSDGRITAMNHEAEALQQFPADATIERVNILDATPLFQLFHADGTGCRPGDIPLARALGGESVEQEELLWSQPDGMRVIEMTATPLRDGADRVVGAVAVVQDVTPRKKLESDLLATSAQLKGIVEQSPVMIWRTDAEGRNNFVNQTYLDYLGMPREQALSTDWAERVHPEDLPGWTETFDAALAERSPFAHEFRIRRADGKYAWVASRGIPFGSESGTFLGYLGTSIDVTEQHDLQAALQHEREIAEASSQHKTRLMSALSHDARTPLNAVVLSAQLLEMHVSDGQDPEVAECLRTIRNGVKNVLDLLGDLLDLTRIDAGAMPREVSRFSLEAAVDECVSSIETPAKLKGLGCRTEYDGLANLTIETDRAKFKQILSNFLSNALRYTERGRIRVYGERTADEIRISVEDTGVGIAPSDLPHIFDEFATLENPRRPGGEGTGLGLAICRRLALLLGGEILVRSEPGHGSTFTLVLPTAIIAETARPEAPTLVTRQARQGGPILVAEDHQDSRQTLARVLRRMGYRVAEAADGAEAVRLALAERPAAILMDVNMPDMDGIDATLAIRAEPSLADLPIFALTGDVTPDNQRRIGDAGVQGYLEKPVTSEALRKALDSLSIVRES